MENKIKQHSVKPCLYWSKWEFCICLFFFFNLAAQFDLTVFLVTHLIWRKKPTDSSWVWQTTARSLSKLRWHENEKTFFFFCPCTITLIFQVLLPLLRLFPWSVHQTRWTYFWGILFAWDFAQEWVNKDKAIVCFWFCPCRTSFILMSVNVNFAVDLSRGQDFFEVLTE